MQIKINNYKIHRLRWRNIAIFIIVKTLNLILFKLWEV